MSTCPSFQKKTHGTLIVDGRGGGIGHVLNIYIGSGHPINKSVSKDSYGRGSEDQKKKKQVVSQT